MNLEQLHRRQPVALPLAGCALAAALGLLARSALAAEGAAADPDWLMMTVELLGGLAIFLFGMMQMEEGLKAVAGERMKGFLATLTVNRFAGRRHGRAGDGGDPVVVGDHGAGRRLHLGRADVAVAVDRRHHGRQHRHDDHRPDRRLQDHQGGTGA